MRHLLSLCILLVIVSLLTESLKAKESTPPTASEAPSPALSEYVAQPDASYQWRKRREGKLGAGTFVELILTSQTWRDIPWKHQVFIYRPSVVESPSQAMLLIAGGRWSDALEKAPDGTNDKMPDEAKVVAALAESMRAPVAVLLQVPEQPLFDGMV
jgi:PhoPQ-activated pathogenicity-related protein